MKKFIYYPIFLLLFVFSTSSFNYLSAQVQTARFVQTTTNSKGYYEYLPQGYASSTEKYPMLLYIHGMGELGDGSTSKLPLVLNNGVARVINKGAFPTSFNVNGKEERMIVISPQFSNWPSLANVNDVINYCISKYRIDQSRIYITGISMGGGVTWDYASNSLYSSRVTAIVPIAGASNPYMSKAQVIATSSIAVWGIHNNNDPTAPVAYTNNYISYINSYNPNPAAIKTIFSSTSHDAWTKGYDPNFRVNNKNVYEWMLQYKRVSPTSITIPAVTAPAPVPTISVTISSNSPVCQGSALNLTASAISGATYAWTGPNGFTSNVQSPTISSATVAASGTYQLTVTANGATDTKTVNVVVNASKTYYKDADNDGFGGLVTTIACVAPAGYVAKAGDCNDNNAAVYPSATEVKDGIDNDCDGVIDNGFTTAPTTTTTTSPVSLGRIEAEDYTNQSGISVYSSSSSSNGKYVGSLVAPDWVEYSITIPQSGTYNIKYGTASPGSAAEFALKANGQLLHTIKLVKGLSYSDWTTTDGSFTLAAGTYTFRIEVIGRGWNLDWFEITSTATTTTSTTGKTTTSTTTTETTAPTTAPATTAPTTTTTTSPVSLGRIEAEDYTNQSGISVYSSSSSSNGKYVGSLVAPDWVEYSVTIPQSGTYNIKYGTASPGSAAEFALKANGQLLHIIQLTKGLSYSDWTTTDGSFTLAAGTYTFRIEVIGRGWNLDWFEITSGSSATRLMNGTTNEQSISAVNAGAAKVATSAFSLLVSPNPTFAQFKVNVQGDEANGLVTIRVSDANGKVVETKQNVTCGQTLLLGSNYTPGMYFIEAYQGKERKVIKAVKL